MIKPISFHIEKEAKNIPADADAVRVCSIEGTEALIVRHDDGSKTLEVPFGKSKDDITRRSLVVLVRKVVQLAKTHGIAKLLIPLSEFSFRRVRLAERELAELVALQCELSNFEFVKYKTPPPEGWKVVTDVLVQGRSPRDIKRGVERGQAIASEVNACRALANTPGGDMTPRLLAEEARKAAADLPVDVTVLDKNKLEQLGMGGVLGVSRGSAEEPQFIIMKYSGGKRDRKSVV